MIRCCAPGCLEPARAARFDRRGRPRPRRGRAVGRRCRCREDPRLASPSCARCRCPSVAVVGDQAHVAPALAAGARGVVLRDQVGPGIHAALAAVRSGLTVMDAALATSLVPAHQRAREPQGPRRADRARAPGRPAALRGSVEQADRGSPRHQRPHREVPRQRRDDEARRFDPDRGGRRGDAPRPRSEL